MERHDFVRRRGFYILQTIGFTQMAVRLCALSVGRFYPQEDSWYSFLLEAESTPVAIVRLEGLSELKIKLPHLASNLRLSVLWLSA
jgi:hypothetical protein